MQLTYRGSVNRWECDENDHLNVRFCEEKLWQTLVSGLLQLGAITEGDVDELPARIACQHLRFQQGIIQLESTNRISDCSTYILNLL